MLESEGLRGGDSVSGNRVTYCLNGAKPVITLAEDLAVEIRFASSFKFCITDRVLFVHSADLHRVAKQCTIVYILT